MSLLETGKRPYIPSKSMYGEIQRLNMLGLVNAPVLQLDDDSLAGFAGAPVQEELYDPVTKVNLLDDAIASVSLDVRAIGRVQLTAHGVSPEQQTILFRRFMTVLTDAQRATYRTQFETARDSGDPAQLQTFLNMMVARLMAA
ncbi:hypothetical protein JKP88DRAFT_285348 [Tribonema minus]|uniref:Uncharacterized protein n=1 Tax=Tribonema minus TaxID=303371 RepID=A0A835ZCU5_9STRA|nr:hypothetical protein JKP88DRAFT_285348 [Tribonema minus]